MGTSFENKILDMKEKKEISFELLSYIFNEASEEEKEYLFSTAREIAQSVFGKNVYLRGLIEFTNYCKNDCYYCGIRCSNKNASRYRLSKDEILSCCDKGAQLGFQTFVLGDARCHWNGTHASVTDERVNLVVFRQE